MKKTLFLSFQGISPIFQAMEAELIQRRQERGEDIWIVECDQAMPTCRFNPTHNLIACAVCTARCRSVMDTLGVPPQRRLKLDASLFPAAVEEPLPATLDELLEYEVEGVNVGRGAASTSISFLRDYDLQTHGKHRGLLQLQLRCSVGVARNYRKILDEVAPDEVMIRNGRHVQTNPMVDICQRRGIPFHTYEAGAKLRGFQLFDNTLPHSIKSRNRIMRELWANAPAAEKREEAAAWFEQKRNRANQEDRVYTSGQEYGLLPENFDHSLHNVVIFNSSEDEMKTILEWRTDLFKHQNDAIRQVIVAAKQHPSVRLYLRVHPNLAGLDNRQMREIADFRPADITVIPAESKIDTYELLAAADVALSFGSTTGVEATYWGTPSVLYGHSFYEDLDAVHHPQSAEALLEYLFDPSLAPKPRENTFPYAYFVNNFGTPYRKVAVVNEREAYVNGKRLRNFLPWALVHLLRYLPALPRWMTAHHHFLGRRLSLGDLFRVHNRKIQEPQA